MASPLPGDASAQSAAPDEERDVLTVAEAAALLRVGRNAMYELIGRGAVPHQRIGKAIRLSRRSLMRWLADGHRR